MFAGDKDATLNRHTTMPAFESAFEASTVSCRETYALRKVRYSLQNLRTWPHVSASVRNCENRAFLGRPATHMCAQQFLYGLVKLASRRPAMAFDRCRDSLLLEE